MALSSLQLDAFSEVARTCSFSRAANNLHITQSALSQRVLNLEAELATALFVRDPSGVRLTSAGEELLRYCQIKEGLEREVLSQLSDSYQSAKGVIRIAGFSSVMRSVVMPALCDLVTKNDAIQVELFSRELRDLSTMLARNESDFIIACEAPNRHDIESHLLGYEENVLVVSSRKKAVPDIYFDHDLEDQTTSAFFTLQKETKKIRRSFVDEVYAIRDAVSLGWGKAVLPIHLVKGVAGIKIAAEYKPLKIPILFQYYRQPYYPKLHQEIRATILSKAPGLLHY